MDRTFVEALVQKTRKPEVVSVNGVGKLLMPVGDGGAFEVEVLDEPLHTVDPLELRTLTGLVDYLNANRDGLGVSGLMIHVVSPTQVRLISMVEGDFKQRHGYADCAYEPPAFPFGQFMDPESFIVALQSRFVDNSDRALVLKVVGNLEDEVVRKVADDGITQNVTARVGVASRSDVVVPRSVLLAPFRTFAEVPQPESPFILRMRSGADGSQKLSCALFEADGGAWKNVAMLSIKAYLSAAPWSEEMKGITVIA